MAVNFPLSALVPTLRRLANREVPQAGRLLQMIEENPHMRWGDLKEEDKTLVRGWKLHLVGMIKRLDGQLGDIREAMKIAADIERDNSHMTPEDFERLGEHHRTTGDTLRSQAFQLASALRTSKASASS